MHLPFSQSDPERLDIKKGIKTIGMDEHSADDKNIQMHKPSKEEVGW